MIFLLSETLGLFSLILLVIQTKKKEIGGLISFISPLTILVNSSKISIIKMMLVLRLGPLHIWHTRIIIATRLDTDQEFLLSNVFCWLFCWSNFFYCLYMFILFLSQEFEKKKKIEIIWILQKDLYHPIIENINYLSIEPSDKLWNDTSAYKCWQTMNEWRISKQSVVR